MEKKINEIMTLVLTLNLNTIDDYFVYYSGHVDRLEVDVHDGGYDAEKERTNLFDAYLSDEDLDKKLDKVIDELKRRLVDAVLRGDMV